MRGWKGLGLGAAVSGVLLLTTLCPGGEEQEPPQYSSEVQRRLEALRERGEPVTFADLTPQEIPPEKNAAIFYRQADEAMVKDDAARRLVFEVMNPGGARRLKTMRQGDESE